MNAQEYDQIRQEYPWLHLPRYQLLFPSDAKRLSEMSRDDLIAMRAGKLLGRGPLTIDQLRGWPHRRQL